MYARRVSLQLKPNTATQLSEKMENEVLPLLRKRAGFQDELTFVSHDGTRAFGLSFWDTKENAEAYAQETYPQVEKLLEPMIQGKPQVGGYTVANSTLDRIAAGTTV